MLRTRRGPRGAIFPDGLPTPREAQVTPRELHVLGRLQAGVAQPAIAAELGKSVHTIRTITRNIREKFDARSVAELLCGIRIGLYTVRKKSEVKASSFNLESALAVPQREYDRSRKHVLQTVRLHHDEISALLGLVQSSYNAGQRARKQSDGILQSCRQHRK